MHCSKRPIRGEGGFEPSPQSGKLGRAPSLVPPDGSRQHGTQSETTEGAHEQVLVAHMGVDSVEDAQKEQQHRRCESRAHREDAGILAPGDVVHEAVEGAGVAHVVDGEHGARKAEPGHGAARHEDGFEGEGRNVADEGHVRVHLARVARLAQGEPAHQQDADGGEPRESRHEREEP